MRIMYDSVEPAAIPVGAQMVAGYINGAASQWPDNAWHRWPAAQLVRIDVIGNAAKQASVLDVERGDATPADAPNWAKARNLFAAGTATIYTGRGNWDAVRQAFHSAGVAEPWWWIADWTGEPHDIAGAAAVQYADPGHGAEGHYDLSAVYSDHWHPAPTWLDGAIKLADQVSTAGATLAHLLQAHK